MGYIRYSCSTELKDEIPRLFEVHGIEVKVVRDPELDFGNDHIRFICLRDGGSASFSAYNKASDFPDEDEQLSEGDKMVFEGDELPVFISPIIPKYERGWKGWFKSRHPTKSLVGDIKKLLLDNGAILHMPIEDENPNR